MTACCLGIGAALAELGERTLIVDGDAKCGSGIIAAGVRELQVYTLADYEKGACRAKQTIITHPALSNLCFMPCTNLADTLFAERAVADVEGLFDYVLLDKIAGNTCDRAVVVTEPFAPSIKSADVCRAHLADNGVNSISLIVNKLNGGQVLSGDTMSASEIAAVLRLPLAAVIPEDLTLSCGSSKGITRSAFRLAAQNITGKKSGVINATRGYNGVGGFFKSRLRSKI